MAKKYIIGLDIGTNSVGWAVIDDNLKLVQGKKKTNDNGKIRKSRVNLWGVRLFDEGETAADRRLKRGQRRRLKRRRERINYLRGIFEPEIMKFDDSFFIRLDESFYLPEDKKSSEFSYRDDNGVLKTNKINKEIFKYPLFKTEEEEKAYYEKFPTIYHLRNHLASSHEKADLREIYLALHHILKYRGHFVNQGESFNLENINIAQNLSETFSAFEDITGFNFGFENIDQDSANKILQNSKISLTKKVYDLSRLYIIDEETVYNRGNELATGEFENLSSAQKTQFLKLREKQVKALFTAIVGNKINIESIFDNPDYSDKTNESFPKNLYFKNEDFEDNLSTLEEFLEPEEVLVIRSAKKVYESIILASILNGRKSLSEAMIEKYNTHSDQLRELKSFSKSVSMVFFKKIFGEGGVYDEYIRGESGKNRAKTLTLEEFYKKLKKIFETQFDGLKFPAIDKEFDFSETDIDDNVQTFLKRMNSAIQFENYLPKQRMFKNGSIPYQIHESELVKIIDRQKIFYPFLGERVKITTEDDDLNKIVDSEYKVQALMKFRIPYYVGPLTDANNGEAGQRKSDRSDFAWLQKRDGHQGHKITPWNFEQIVDKDRSATEFIERMTSFCTYLPDEKVLPKNSLIYQEFNVYNELMTSGYIERGFDGKNRKEYFSPELRQDIVEKLFKKYRKVTAEKLIHFLTNEYQIQVVEIFGIDRRTLNGKPSFNNSLSSYIDLTQKAGISPEIVEGNKEKFEEIIKWQTIFEDRKVLRKTIKKANLDWQILEEDQTKKLANKHYSGFGNLSKKLIDGIRDRDSNQTILEQLKYGKYNNFMRLISGETGDNYSYKDQIENFQTEKMVNGGLSYSIVKDLAGSPAIKKGIWQSLKIIKELEVYLGKENISRIVVEMARGGGGGRTRSRYKQLERFYADFEEKNQEVLTELSRYEKNEDALRSEKLYLYFMQNGKCAYTNEELNIENLSIYEVDHIVPQSLLKDDSIDNKVLVTKVANQQKGGDLPSLEVIAKMKTHWEILVKAKLMSQKKFKSLTMGRIGDKAREGFLNRQLVETRQITKNVANILAKHFEDVGAVILTPQSSLSSQFRKGKIYLPNPKFNSFDAKQDPENYPERWLIEKELHEGFPKSRDINDYHHAHDAYLNALVANYLYLTKPELKNAWVYGKYQRNSKDEFGKWVRQRKDKSLQLLSDMDQAEWKFTNPDTGEMTGLLRDEVIENVRKTFNYKNINIVRKTEMQIGKFGDESICKKDEKSKNFANGLKGDLSPNKYGGTKKPISAFTVIIKNNKEQIKPVSIPSMLANEYFRVDDKLSFLKMLYPNDNISEIIVEKVAKYTKYILPNGVTRLSSSFQEAQNASQLSLKNVPNEKSDDSTFEEAFDGIARFIENNKLFAEAKLVLLKGKIRDNFIRSNTEGRLKILSEMIRVSKGSSQDLKYLSESGLGTTAQQLKAGNILCRDSTLVHQSSTGLYEVRQKIE